MFIDLLRNRRSIRQFQDKPLEPEKLDIIIEAVLRSPSSRSLNPWEFIVVTEKETIENLALAKAHGSTFMSNAACAVVVCADPERSDVWIEDTSIAALILHLAAADLGLGSCWVQIRQREHDSNTSAEDYVTELLDIKEGLVVEAMVAIGYAGEEKPGHEDVALLRERVSFERYGNRK
jgi:nitroreductase